MSEQEMKNKQSRIAASSTDPLEKLRARCLARGVDGISKLQKTFKIFDDDESKSLNKEEFKKGMKTYQCGLTDEETEQLFGIFDEDDTGTINFDEFIENVRPPMSPARKAIIEKCFQKMDKTGDGYITVADMKGVYNCKQHPQYMNGEMTEAQVFEEYLKKFEKDSKEVDGRVTLEEFINYYSGVSASIDQDAYFDLMMRNSFKI